MRTANRKRHKDKERAPENESNEQTAAKVRV